MSLPSTIDGVEIVWTLLGLVAFVSSGIVWTWARQDLAYARSVGRRQIARSFLEDVRNARWRLWLAGSLAAAGIVAMTQPPTTQHRSPSGWIILVLIFAAPVQIIVRNWSEATTRRAILRDVHRQDKNGSTPRPGGD